MKKLTFFLLVSLFTFSLNAQVNVLEIDASGGKTQINKNIYGQFAEHLGRCIYDGIWVGKNSPIPNVNGYRKDLLEALQALKIPVLRWPGGCFADTYHWKTASAHWLIVRKSKMYSGVVPLKITVSVPTSSLIFANCWVAIHTFQPMSVQEL